MGDLLKKWVLEWVIFDLILISLHDTYYFFLGKTHFEVLVLLCLSTFRPFTFILRHCILILLFSYSFRPSVSIFDKMIHTRG